MDVRITDIYVPMIVKSLRFVRECGFVSFVTIPRALIRAKYSGLQPFRQVAAMKRDGAEPHEITYSGLMLAIF